MSDAGADVRDAGGTADEDDGIELGVAGYGGSIRFDGGRVIGDFVVGGLVVGGLVVSKFCIAQGLLAAVYGALDEGFDQGFEAGAGEGVGEGLIIIEGDGGGGL